MSLSFGEFHWEPDNPKPVTWLRYSKRVDGPSTLWLAARGQFFALGQGEEKLLRPWAR